MPKTASPNGTIDFTRLSPAVRRFEWFTMDAAEGDDAEPFRVRAQRLTVAEVEAIPADETPIADVLVANRRYLTGWNLTAMTDTGETQPVPPPAELDDASFRVVLDRLLLRDQVMWMYQVLKAGHLVKMVAEKKASIRSATSPASSPEAN